MRETILLLESCDHNNAFNITVCRTDGGRSAEGLSHESSQRAFVIVERQDAPAGIAAKLRALADVVEKMR